MNLKNSIIPICVIGMVIITCIMCMHANYTKKTILTFYNMQTPVTLYDETKNTFWYSVVLKDGKGDLHRFGNMSSFANDLGNIYNIGDTLRYKLY